MDEFEMRLRQMETMTPKKGFNLVGVDTFEDPGNELYFIGHFSTRAAAEREKKNRLKKNPHEVVHVYEPE